MTEQKELQLAIFNAKDKDHENLMSGLLKMFYSGTLRAKIGIAQLKDGLYLVGVEDSDTDEHEFYPLAKVLVTEEVQELLSTDE